jgi:hypothetical protein
MLLVLAMLVAHVPSSIKLVPITDPKHGVTIAIPQGWTPKVDSPYQVVARGPAGGLKTHLCEKVPPERAIRGFFADSGEPGEIHIKGRWACAQSRAWRLNPRTDVVVCARQLEPDWVIVLSLQADKAWLRKAGGETFLRAIAATMRGFHTVER